MPSVYVVEQLVEESLVVLEDCAVGTGAIVAANSTKGYYSSTAENYCFSWAADAAYQLVAAHLIRMPGAGDTRADYLNWLLNRCNNFSTTGEIYKRYSPNGSSDIRYGSEYQPDQAGTLAWALHQTAPETDKNTEKVLRLLANGLVRNWARTHFSRPIQDRWENQLINPEQNEVFTYSLAMAVQGLSAVIERFSNMGLDAEMSDWQEARQSMLEVLAAETRPSWYKTIRSDGELTARTIDASLLGLAYPFKPPTNQPGWRKRQISTVDEVNQQLFEPGLGLHRYAGDTYDGIVRPGGQEAVAGAWPLLDFWQSIALQVTDRSLLARKTYGQAVKRLASLYSSNQIRPGHIPEQIFPDSDRQGKGVVPLGWAHAKFVIATVMLNV